MNLAEYTITEAGFGADLGAEKFLDIKCRMLLPKEVNEEGEEEDPRADEAYEDWRDSRFEVKHK